MRLYLRFLSMKPHMWEFKGEINIPLPCRYIIVSCATIIFPGFGRKNSISIGSFSLALFLLRRCFSRLYHGFDGTYSAANFSGFARGSRAWNVALAQRAIT